MTKVLLTGLSILAILASLPLIAAVVVTTSTQAAAECPTQSNTTVTSTPNDLDKSGSLVGGPPTGAVAGPTSTTSVEARNGNAGTAVPDTASRAASRTSDVSGDTATDTATAPATAPATGEVLPALMQLRISDAHPTLTTEQARNAVTIAHVARELRVSRHGLQIAIATAIQESKLINLRGGDRDSAGLFQQRPSTGWGTRAQIINPTLAAQAFFGRGQHTSNPGLLDIPGWEQMPLTEAAQAVQRSRFPDAYAQWEATAEDVTAILGGDLPDVPGSEVENASSAASCTDADTIVPITIGSLNLLGAGHTDGQAGGGKERGGFDNWQTRLPGAMSSLEKAGVTIAALQEVHAPQADALASRYSQQWGMFPSSGPAQNKVIWDLDEWTATDQRLVDIPYFGGKDVGMPLVQLTSTITGQAIWVWSVHNPADTRGNASGHRAEALRRQVDTLGDLVATGTPTVIGGDFNDGGDGQNASHCVLTPTLTNAFGGSSAPCRRPKRDASIDHLYGANLSWASARVDNSIQSNRISDHPLVVATTAGSSVGCALDSGATNTDYKLGPVKPRLTQLVNVLGPMFNIKTVGGYRASATDPSGHPAGLAADFTVPRTPVGRDQGQALADYAKQHAGELEIDYIIWYQQIWSTSRAGEGWRPMADRGSATENHRDHIHINVNPGASVSPTSSGDQAANCSEIVYPVPTSHVASDARNWHSEGGAWNSWHTGTDFAAPCGTPVYAAHSGAVEIDTTQSWAGPTLVKISTGASSLTTWYAHMQQVTVSRGATVQAGQQIGMTGNEGNSRGCHLHFEVHLKNGSIYDRDNVDPSQWLAENASPNRRHPGRSRNPTSAADASGR